MSAVGRWVCCGFLLDERDVPTLVVLHMLLWGGVDYGMNFGTVAQASSLRLLAGWVDSVDYCVGQGSQMTVWSPMSQTSTRPPSGCIASYGVLGVLLKRDGSVVPSCNL